jgi:hypothetical protein
MAKSSQRTSHDSGETIDRSGGVDVEGDVSVGGDVAGRDVVKAGRDIVTNIDDRDVINVGYSAKAVQRLVITVGALVFATAACFFSGGVILGAQVIGRLNDPPVDANGQATTSSTSAAADFEDKLDAAQGISADQGILFSEDELSSYIKFIAGDRLGLSDGKARFIEPGVIAISGQLRDLGNLYVAATFRLQENPQQPLRLERVAAQVLPFGGSFGWVAVPNALLGSFENRLNAELNGMTIRAVQEGITSNGAEWALVGDGQ